MAIDELSQMDVEEEQETLRKNDAFHNAGYEYAKKIHNKEVKGLKRKISELEAQNTTSNNTAMSQYLCEIRDLLSVNGSYELAINIKSIQLSLNDKIAELQQ